MWIQKEPHFVEFESFMGNFVFNSVTWWKFSFNQLFWLVYFWRTRSRGSAKKNLVLQFTFQYDPGESEFEVFTIVKKNGWNERWKIVGGKITKMINFRCLRFWIRSSDWLPSIFSQSKPVGRILYFCGRM